VIQFSKDNPLHMISNMEKRRWVRVERNRKEKEREIAHSSLKREKSPWFICSWIREICSIRKRIVKKSRLGTWKANAKDFLCGCFAKECFAPKQARASQCRVFLITSLWSVKRFFLSFSFFSLFSPSTWPVVWCLHSYIILHACSYSAIPSCHARTM